MDKMIRLGFGIGRQICKYQCYGQKLGPSWQPNVYCQRSAWRMNRYPACMSVMAKQVHTSSCSCAATRKKKTKKKITKPVKLRQQNRKASWEVVEIWRDMTVNDVARSLRKELDHIFEALIYVPGTDSFDKPNSVIHDFNVIKEVVDKCGFRWKIVGTKKQMVKENKDVNRRPPADPSLLTKRPPVVTIMGHVDHGKTTLLDSLRKTNVVASEFGGITQHIGAFSVNLVTGENVTFLDTPGHAAFSTMRARGANVTDIVVLVVAADDGVMEQTVESIKFAKDANVPIIVAINKIDKYEADVERTKQLLLQHGLQLEDNGGDVQAVPVSALKGTNLDGLLESILTLADVLDVKGDWEGMVEGVVIESRTETGRGKLSTALIQRGTLTKGSYIVAGNSWAKVKSMFDENGHHMMKASPGMPVEIVGWKELPSAGDEIIQVESEKRAKEVISWRLGEQMEQKALEDHEVIKVKQAEHYEMYNRERQAKLDRGIRFSAIYRRKPVEVSVGPTDPELAIIVKGDVHGSVEAILDTIATYESPQCRLRLVNYDVGDICEEDIEMASPFKGVVYAFNVKCADKIHKLALDNKVDIVFSNVIYMMIDDLRQRLSQRLPKIELEEIVGEAHVLQTFIIDEGKKKIAVAGCRCTKGVLKKKNMFKLVRDGDVILTGPLLSLKHFKHEVESIPMNSECGLSFENKTIVPQHGDTILCYEMKQQPQELDWDLMY